jgi:hypothetical protein
VHAGNHTLVLICCATGHLRAFTPKLRGKPAEIFLIVESECKSVRYRVSYFNHNVCLWRVDFGSFNKGIRESIHNTCATGISREFLHLATGWR